MSTKQTEKKDIPAALLLNRCAYGPTERDLDALRAIGPSEWISQQLNPPAQEDAVVSKRLADLRLRIRYAAGQGYAARDEMAPLSTLDKPIEQVWNLADFKQPMAGNERSRPRFEVAAATLVRAAYSPWQLREVMVDFWHNHFNVYAMDAPISVALPTYDRDVIRKHCLGNFRAFLEAVATSTAMLYYLNNRSSRAGIANENYARELFELHTLGRDHYLNEYYSRWRDVPGATTGKPTGYIDQDVYEAARAFTGWVVEDGTGLGGGQNLPQTGKFTYVETWHDNYQKRVLATDFDPFQPPMADGRKVLDLVAAHPGTADYVCTKLCRRLLGDTPSKAMLASVTAVWRKHLKSPDQIARTIEFILHTPEFADSAGARVKRPVDLVVSYVRATGIDFTPTDGFIYELDGSGQRLFGWAPPTGHPDNNDYWLSSHVMRKRWGLLMGLTDNWWNTGAIDPRFGLGGGSTAAGALAVHWMGRFGNRAGEMDRIAGLLDGLGLAPDRVLNNDQGGLQQMRRIVAFAAMSPDFQYC
ncbi:MAG: DUF1800 domain-containing protein [Burkholderiales bacterium]|nr:DUF1800 domain-containing protein [Burkholderiales bacterium]